MVWKLLFRNKTKVIFFSACIVFFLKFYLIHMLNVHPLVVGLTHLAEFLHKAQRNVDL